MNQAQLQRMTSQWPVVGDEMRFDDRNGVVCGGNPGGPTGGTRRWRVRNHVRARLVLATAVLGCGLAATALADTALASRHDVSIEPQPLAAALKALASQTGVQLVVLSQDAANKRSVAVHGSLTTEEALTRLLDDSGLTYSKVDDNTVAITKVARPAALRSTSYTGGNGSAATLAVSDTPAGSGAGEAGPVAADEGTGARDSGLQEVVVTGSRLSRPGMTSPTPVTSLSTEELAAVSPQSISQGLAQLPSMSASTVPSSVGGRTTLGPGTFLNLRGLGPTRNLILLDGTRIAPSNVAGYVDVNLLPQGLIKDVQVVTGGASAAYGSDAVAGVTNFILDTRFNGFKVDVNGGVSGVADGAAVKTSLVWGKGFMDDRLHAEVSFDWRHQQPAFSDNRSWSNSHCGYISVPGVTAATATPDNPLQTFACGVTQPNSAYGGVLMGAPWATSTGSISFGPGGVPQPFTYGALKTTNTQVGGSADAVPVGNVVNFYEPNDNKVLFGRLSYDISDNVQAFGQITASRNDVTYAQTPPYLNASTALTIFSGNPFIPASIQSTMTANSIGKLSLGITPMDWGNIDAHTAEQSYDAIFGLKGRFGGSYNWDFHAEHGRTQFHEQYLNDVNLANLYRALDVVEGPLGTPVCRVTLTNPSAANNLCQPLNPFGVGSASPAALAYIHATAEEWNVVTQTDVAANINGEPFSLWAGPVSLGTGVEWRRLEGVQSSDDISHNYIDFTGVRGVASAYLTQLGGWLTTNAPAYGGSENVTEGYVETLIPLLKDQFLARALDLNAAGRVTHYSQSGTVETWKAGLTWRPVDELLIRATESSDIRAPGISDLYQGVSYSPPVNGVDYTHGGVPYLVSVGTQGNPGLTPEKARTFTGGFTWQPSFLSGFSLSADYYDIKISDVIATTSAQDTVLRCSLGQQLFCNNIYFNGVLGDPSAGAITSILTPSENLNLQRTRGIDLESNYRMELAGGTLGFRGVATKLLEQSTTTQSATGAKETDVAGSILSGAPTWIAMTNVNWAKGPLSMDVIARYISGGPYYSFYTTSQIDSRYYNEPSIITFDTGVHYRFTSLPGVPEVYFNVQNLFDKAPPILGGATLIGFQTNSSLYDTMGRYFTIGVRASF